MYCSSWDFCSVNFPAFGTFVRFIFRTNFVTLSQLLNWFVAFGRFQIPSGFCVCEKIYGAMEDIHFKSISSTFKFQLYFSCLLPNKSGSVNSIVHFINFMCHNSVRMGPFFFLNEANNIYGGILIHSETSSEYAVWASWVVFLRFWFTKFVS